MKVPIDGTFLLCPSEVFNEGGVPALTLNILYDRMYIEIERRNHVRSATSDDAGKSSQFESDCSASAWREMAQRRS
jgi:hypothetical protein